MEQAFHGSDYTTPAVGRAIQTSLESLVKLAHRYGLDPETVYKSRGRATMQGAPMGPANHISTVVSPLEEAATVAFRQRTLLPLDDCLYTLQGSIPHLSCSALHHLFKRHVISCLSGEVHAEGRVKRPSSPTPLAIFTPISPKCALMKASCICLSPLTVPASWSSQSYTLRRQRPGQPTSGNASWWQCHTITTVLTDNGMQFTQLPHRRRAEPHSFDAVCATHGIEHRCTKVAHPQTNGQVERMNRTLKKATFAAITTGTRPKLPAC